MTSYILINYDTTKPEIQLYAPTHTTGEIDNVVTIEANEDLSLYQEFYVIDMNGNRHDYTFHMEDKRTFVGKLRLNNMPIGIVTIYARVKDEVGNISNLIYKTVEIKEYSVDNEMTLKDSQREVTLFEKFMATSISISENDLLILDKVLFDIENKDFVSNIDLIENTSQLQIIEKRLVDE